MQFTKLYVRDFIFKSMENTEANRYMCISERINLAVY